MKTSDNPTRAHLRVVKRDEDHPSYRQGRNKHNDPKVSRDALKAVAFVVVPALLVTLIVWAVRTYAGRL